MSILQIKEGVDMSFEISWKLHLLCFTLGYLLCFAMNNLVNKLFLSLLIEHNFIYITGNIFLDFMIYIFIIMIPVTFVHELMHGAAYSLFGGKVKYGFKGLYAYARETSGIALHRTKFLVVLLAPITIISVMMPGVLGTLIFLLNLLGIMGDLLMAFYLCKSNKNSYVIDRKYGFDII